jgi:hypothetical protein
MPQLPRLWRFKKAAVGTIEFADLNSDEWQGKKLAIIKTKGDALKLIDRSTQAQGDRRVMTSIFSVANTDFYEFTGYSI